MFGANDLVKEGRLRRFKWRVFLSVLNLLLALGLSELGMLEYNKFNDTHPGAFYHGHHAYLPVAQLVSYCINASPFFLANLMHNLPVWRSVGRGSGGFITLTGSSMSFSSCFGGGWVSVTGKFSHAKFPKKLGMDGLNKGNGKPGGRP